MPHFFISSSSIESENIVISDKENYNHIAKSLRARVGEKLLLIDENRIQYQTVIEKIDSSQILTTIMEKYPSKNMLGFDLYLAQVPLKSDAQSLVIEKATELGVKGIYPVYSDNCAVKKDIIVKKIPKWQKIMAEASKQCERADVPKCFELTTIEKLGSFDKVIVLCERDTSLPLKKYFEENKIKKGESVLIIVGPEGGFSKREFDYFEAKNFVKASLGEIILKAETAVIIGLGNVVYEFG